MTSSRCLSVAKPHQQSETRDTAQLSMWYGLQGTRNVGCGSEMTWRNKQKPTKRESPSFLQRHRELAEVRDALALPVPPDMSPLLTRVGKQEVPAVTAEVPETGQDPFGRHSGPSVEEVRFPHWLLSCWLQGDCAWAGKGFSEKQ